MIFEHYGTMSNSVLQFYHEIAQEYPVERTPVE